MPKPNVRRRRPPAHSIKGYDNKGPGPYPRYARGGVRPANFLGVGLPGGSSEVGCIIEGSMYVQLPDGKRQYIGYKANWKEAHRLICQAARNIV